MRAALALLLVSCGGSDERLELALTLDGACDGAVASVSLMSVEVYGHDAAGEPCALARRCIDVHDATTLGDLEEAMRAVRQPLVDVELGAVELVTISGHSTNDCFASDDRVMCGFADLAAASEGRLPITLECGAGVCSDEEVRLCP